MKTTNLSDTLLSLCALFASGIALHAQVLLNGDFSSPAVNNSYTSSAPTDFTAISVDDTGVISTSVNYIGGLSTNPISPQIEYQSGGATTAVVDPATSIGLYQVVGALQADTTYTFTAGEALASQYNGSGTFELALYTTTDLTDPLQTLQGYTDTASADAGYNQFVFQSTPSFTTGSNPTGYLTVVLSYANGDVTPAGQAYFAEASLTAVTTPEPSTWALMLLGLGGLAFGLRARAARNA